MHFVIKTLVNQSLQSVWNGFDLDLFNVLSPPFPPVKVLRFDGCMKGDIVALELNFILFKQVWESEIIEQNSGSTEIYFIDKGTKLPFFLRYWHHRHRIISEQSQTYIIDDITFKTPNILLDIVFYPVLYLLFLYRKPIYKRVFSR
ncbi:SRPBCC family protein [Flectobacillus major]|uniref:SRPBCC family protein n=1 Tax=Flectobacillus major TaxID=103 RepID=UPI00042434AC|nr:hypothetical protein [Flectobacillus major]